MNKYKKAFEEMKALAKELDIVIILATQVPQPPRRREFHPIPKFFPIDYANILPIEEEKE